MESPKRSSTPCNRKTMFGTSCLLSNTVEPRCSSHVHAASHMSSQSSELNNKRHKSLSSLKKDLSSGVFFPHIHKTPLFHNTLKALGEIKRHVTLTKGYTLALSSF